MLVASYSAEIIIIIIQNHSESPKMNSRLEFALAVVCAVLALVFSAAAQGIMQPTLTGTCASIGYSTACCPPGAQCEAMDGNCHCGADCHTNGDCCPDAQCSRGE